MPLIFIKNISKCTTAAVSRKTPKGMLFQDICDYINSVLCYFSTVEGNLAGFFQGEDNDIAACGLVK